MLRLPFVFSLLVLLASQALAESGADRVRARVEKLFDDVEVTSVVESPVKGLYEVMLGPSVLYMSADGRYVMRGDMIDLDTRTNLSDARRASARSKAFAAIDRSEVIEFAPAGGPAKATLYVYTDIDCGYCRKLHREVPQLNAAGIAVRYLAYPRSGLDGDSFKKAVAVWCSADRQAAMTAAKAGKDVEAAQCDNPVAAQFTLGRAMGITGTPAVYSDKGEQIGGYVPAKELISMLKEGRI